MNIINNFKAFLILCIIVISNCQYSFAGDANHKVLPNDLKWISGNDQPLFADPNAKSGGTLNLYFPSFPLTMRTIGPDANVQFRSYLMDGYPALLAMQPNTLKPIPAIAKEWAFGSDHQTMYFKLDPNAKWSDGVPITAEDFAFFIDYVKNKNTHAPFYREYYTNKVTNITVYDEHTISLRSGDKLSENQLIDTINMSPKPKHFFKNGITKNYLKEYNWKPEPTTGAYYVSKIKKGRTIELSKVKNWWGYKNKYFQHRFNVDKIRFNVIRDPDLAYKYFEKGELDVFNLANARLWYDKTNSEPFKKGYIVKSMLKNNMSQGASGVWLNTTDPLLENEHVRAGIAHSIDIDTVIKSVLHNDAERQQGFGTPVGAYKTHLSMDSKTFDPKQARNEFAKAGYNTLGSDGILYNKKGTPLSITLMYLSPKSTPVVIVLKEQAKKAGLNIDLKLVDGSTGFKSLLEKKFQIAYFAMGTSLYPAYWQYFDSSNAIPQTNNFFNFNSKEMDRLIKKFDSAFNEQEKVKFSNLIQKKIMKSNCFIPGVILPFARAAHWRYVKLPSWLGTAQTSQLFDSFGLENGLYWIDQDEKAELKQAMKNNKTYPMMTHLGNATITNGIGK